MKNDKVCRPPYSIYFVIYTNCISENRYYIKGICSLSELSVKLVDIAKVGLVVFRYEICAHFYFIVCDYWLIIVIQKIIRLGI